MQPVILVDMDETLLHSERWYGDTHPAERLAKQYAFREKLRRRMGKPLDRRVADDHMRRVTEAPVITVGGDTFSVVEHPNAKPFLQGLAQSGSVHIFTAADPTYAEMALQATGLRPLVGHVFSTRGQLPPPIVGPWVLIDDVPDMRKVALMSHSPSCQVIKVDPFMGHRVTELPTLRSNPADLEGRHIPEKYLAGLPPKLRAARIRELSASRSGRTGYEPLPTDLAAQRMGLVKRSKYSTAADARGIEHRGDYEDTARRALRYYGVPTTQQNVRTVARELEKVFKKGLAAWRTGGHRPGASQSGWAYARVASVLVGGKAAYTADKKNVAKFPAKMRQGIERQRVWRETGRRAAANPLDYEAEVQKLIDTAPHSWVIAFRQHGLPAKPSVDEVVDVMLERTAGGNDAGPRGRATLAPPDAVRKEALHGLRLSHENDYAGWDGIGLARAVQLATQPTIWRRSVDRMYAFFRRNRRYMTYSTFGDDVAASNSWMAWLNWGGTSGYRWAASVTGREFLPG